MRKNILLFFIFLIAFSLRFIWLDVVPNAIGGDELTYLMTAKAIYLTGSDVSGTWDPLSVLLFNYPDGEKQAELLYFLVLPFVGPFPFSILNSHIIGAGLSFLTVILIYLIGKKLLGEKAGIIAAFLAAVNPWFIFIGRTAYEMNPAVFFYLLSFYLLLVLKNWKILFVAPILLLAFYSYIGTKLAFLPFVALSLAFVYFYQGKKKFKKQYLFLLGFSIFLVVSFIFLLKANSSSSRMSEILTPFSPLVNESVMANRKASIPSPVLTLVENKITVFTKIISAKTANVFSFGYLFFHGDNFFSLYNHGLFYPLDLIFLTLGLFVLWQKKKLFLFLIGFILIAISPQVFFADLGNFTPHITLLFPFLIFVSAAGVEDAISYFRNIRFSNLALFGASALYIFSVVNFLNIYFFQFPLQGHFDFSLRVLSKYITTTGPIIEKDGREIVVLSPRNRDIYKKFLFYGNAYNKETASMVAKNLKENKLKHKGVEFVGCNPHIDLSNHRKVYIYSSECESLNEKGGRLTIVKPVDGAEQFSIYNDIICSNLTLERFPITNKLSIFRIEGMNKEDFCKSFIFKP